MPLLSIGATIHSDFYNNCEPTDLVPLSYLIPETVCLLRISMGADGCRGNAFSTGPIQPEKKELLP